MVDPSTVLWLVALVVLVAVSAFFSSSESAVFSLGSEPVPGEGPDAAALARLREDPHRLLVTLLVGNNVVNVAVSSIVTLLVSRYVAAGAAVVVATALAATLVLVFGEIVPKAYGLAHAREWSLRVARPVTYVERALSPVVAAFDAVTRRLAALVGGDRHIEETYLDE